MLCKLILLLLVVDITINLPIIFNNRINKRSINNIKCHDGLKNCIDDFYDKLENEIEFQSEKLCILSKRLQNCFGKLNNSSNCSEKVIENFQLLFQAPCDEDCQNLLQGLNGKKPCKCDCLEEMTSTLTYCSVHSSVFLPDNCINFLK